MEELDQNLNSRGLVSPWPFFRLSAVRRRSPSHDEHERSDAYEYEVCLGVAKAADARAEQEWGEMEGLVRKRGAPLSAGG